MEPTAWIILLFIVGTLLLVGELFIPSHGAITAVAVLCFAIAIGIGFSMGRWIGVSMLAGAALASPFVAYGMLKAWERTPLARKMILHPPIHAGVESPVALPSITVGMVGTTVSELRPMGECDFGEHRVQAISELGIIPARTSVVVIRFHDGVATVRRTMDDRA
jgi:membrane-bound serine protease (ClpP class)